MVLSYYIKRKLSAAKLPKESNQDSKEEDGGEGLKNVMNAVLALK
jgi:hypothetical protein